MYNLTLFRFQALFRNFYLYMPVQTFFLLSHGIPLEAVVFSTTFYSLFAFLGEVPTGVFADSYGQKISLIFGYTIEGLGLLLVFLFPSVMGLYAGASLQGFAGAFLSGSEEALLYETVQAHKRTDYQKVYAQFLADGQASFMVATALAGVLYQTYGAASWSGLMLGTAISTLLAGVCALFLTDYKGDLPPDLADTGSKALETVREGFKLILKNDTIFTLTLVTLLTVAGEYFLLGVYQPHFEAHNVSAFWIGAVLSLGAFLNIVATRNIHRLENRFRLPTLLLFLNGILGLLYLGLAFFTFPVVLILLYVAMNGLFNLQTPIVSDYINTRTSSRVRATVLSGISFVRRFFQIGFTWVLGSIVGIWGIGTGLATQGVYLLIGAALSYYLLVRCGCAHKVFETSMEPIEI